MTPAELLSCSDLSVVRPEDATANGCTILTKLRHVVTNKGVNAVVEWDLRNSACLAVVLPSSCFGAGTDSSLSLSDPPAEDAGSIVVRYTTCDGLGQILENDAVVVDSAAGSIRFELPTELTEYAGLYRMEIGVYDADERLLFTDQGLISVERGLFGDQTLQRYGPPTISEIRMALRDSAIENNLLDDVEFTADEIVFTVLRPIAEWNETPPNVGQYTCANFPWREAWLKGIISYLLQTAVFHYTRNKLAANHGGLSVNDKDKDREYQMLSQKFREEWREWMFHKKVETNVRSCFGGIGSTYRTRW